MTNLTNLNFPLLYEDHDLMVIDKPAHVVVNRAESVKEPTIQDWASTVIPRVSEGSHNIAGRKSQENVSRTALSGPNPDDFFTRSGIVHRLDKETSGCLVIAKNPESYLALQAAFKERLVKKTYIALVHGRIPSVGEINAPVGRLPWNKEQFGIVPGGKESVTRYRGVKSFELRVKGKKEILTLVELNPESGRTHQIRVHLKYLGFPIVGDYLYAGRKLQKADRVWCPRVFLHAAKITFPHPTKGKEITVESPLPHDLGLILAKLTPAP